MPIEKTCLNCGKTFTVIPARKDTAKFCSIKCLKGFHTVKNKCDNCGKIFETYASKPQQFCSRQCYFEYFRKNVWIKKPPNKVCQVCGKEFYVIPSRLQTAKYCSVECRREGQKIPNKLKKGKCLHCGKEFTYYPKEAEGMFCSVTCLNRHKAKDPEYLRKLSKNTKHQWKRMREKMTIALKKAANTPEHIKKQRKAAIKMFSDPKVRKKISEAKIELYKDPKEREKMSRIKKKQFEEHPEILKKILKSIQQKPNKMEEQLLEIVQPFGFEYVGNGDLIIGRKCPDFVNHEENKIIELFGEPWHEEEEEEQRTKFFQKHGYDTLIIWSSDLDNADDIESRVEEFINA